MGARLGEGSPIGERPEGLERSWTSVSLVEEVISQRCSLFLWPGLNVLWRDVTEFGFTLL